MSRVISACGAKQPNLSRKLKLRSKKVTRPQKLRGNIYRQSRAQQQCGNVKDHQQKAVFLKVSILEIPKKRETSTHSSIAERWDLDPVCRESLRCEGRTRTFCEVSDHDATTQTQTDPTNQRTEAPVHSLLPRFSSHSLPTTPYVLPALPSSSLSLSHTHAFSAVFSVCTC